MTELKADRLKSMPRSGLEKLLSLLTKKGFRLLGPTVSNGAIVIGDIATTADLPVGWTDRQAPGSYRLQKTGDNRAFDFVVGPHAWKQYLFPARETLHRATFDKAAGLWRQSDDNAVATAFIGARACDLAAMAIQDRVFIGGEYIDRGYHNRRQASFIVAVNCLRAGDLCFCDSMGTGPEVKSGFDICLTEFDDTFLVQAGSRRGEKVVAQLPIEPATENQCDDMMAGLAQCRQQMGRHLETENLEGLLFANLEHPQWDNVAERCLACGNCTMVCPTCFCYSVDETADLGVAPPQRERSWDSCFSQQHSQVNGASFQPAVKDRYRQWLTHKLGAWKSQFGTSGCVGCGRCIAWCPVGIDLTEEVAAIGVGAAPPVPMPEHRPIAVKGADSSTAPLFATTKVSVTDVVAEAPEVKTLVLNMPADYHYQPGQFNMLSLPGIGEVPISLSGNSEGAVEHTIRSVGNVTAALSALKFGATLDIRGPYGSAWPMAQTRDRPVTVVAGGIGLAPLRGVMRSLANEDRDNDTEWVRLIYGARRADALLFTRELKQWQQNPALRVAVTVDQSTRDWTGNVGTVITLLRRKDIPVNGLYFVCGPEVMMLAVVRLLREAQVPPQNIYLSMERNMKCAAGHCGRCQYGPYFICKDGPVFSYDRLAFLFGKQGF
ncbi:hypothetical protein FKG94_00860 [Exilibacterium tricleocarpae]|uniref:Sulfite reductase subunit A n=1 Tax=Exilibacterium tricleocarpae TaxID=2591008 RepID=A0A545U9M8_9GAMM|nr:4Fe-4S dicluster domain-containing protein [Exilibacterium tricleocarpae]TQV86139.1 hypothetical protein FKG94_00860 [Exilibacterium tricleocarpae]